MILIIEPICHSNEHVPFCAAFVASLMSALPYENIVYVGASSQVDNVETYLLKNDVEISKVSWVKDIHTVENAPPYKEALQTLKTVNNLVNRYTPRKIFISTASTLGLFVLSKFRLRKEIPLYAILHRSTTQLKSNKGIVKMASHFIFKQNFNKRKVYPLVLSSEILNEIKDLKPRLYNQLRFIDHPYLFPNVDNAKLLVDVNKIGFIGMGSKSRGYDVFLKIRDIVNYKMQFYGIGKLSDDLKGVTQIGLEHSMSDTHLSSGDYANLLANLDVVLMPISNEYYTLAISGALLDALAYGKPILLLEGVFSQTLLKKYGRIGKVFKDYKEIASYLNGDINLQELNEIKLHQKKCRYQFSVSKVGSQLNAIINENSTYNN